MVTTIVRHREGARLVRLVGGDRTPGLRCLENASCLSAAASLTTSGNPAACRFAAMGRPMLPRPTNPMVSSPKASIVIERAPTGRARQAQTFPGPWADAGRRLMSL